MHPARKNTRVDDPLVMITVSNWEGINISPATVQRIESTWSRTSCNAEDYRVLRLNRHFGYLLACIQELTAML